MRQITVRYQGECKKCGQSLEVGQPAIYEKSMGIFCIGCEPKDTEEIRAFRLAKAERKAEKYEEWADAAEKRSIQYNEESRSMMSVIPMGQPILVGHYSEGRDRRYRDRAWNKMGKAVKENDKAKHHRDKAENLRNVRVAGDAERKRQAKREALDSVISKGTRVNDPCFGDGEVIGIYPKSYRIKFDRNAFVCSRDKIYIKLLE